MTDARNSLNIGRNVIGREAEGLRALEASIGAEFESAVQTILAGQGHSV